ncbi:MAG: universal stress protein [Thiomonas sp.]
MNVYGSILVHLNQREQAYKVCTLAAQIAAKQGARLNAVHAADAEGWDVRDLVAEIAQAQGVVAQCNSIAEGVAQLVECTRIADLLVIGQPGKGDNSDFSLGSASQLLVGASCPVLFVPAPASLGTTCGARVLVSWGPGRESARALRDALPLLQRATEVQLRAYGAGRAPAEDGLIAACAYLQLHGVKASYSAERMGDIDFNQRMLTPTVVDASVAELLLSQAADMEADLIVMGGYGHSRAHEFLLGGVTRSMLSSMTVPVFMSH